MLIDERNLRFCISSLLYTLKVIIYPAIFTKPLPLGNFHQTNTTKVKLVTDFSGEGQETSYDDKPIHARKNHYHMRSSKGKIVNGNWEVTC